MPVQDSYFDLHYVPKGPHPHVLSRHGPHSVLVAMGIREEQEPEPVTNSRVQAFRTDPTGTGSLRRRYEVQFEKRLKALRKLIKKKIAQQNALNMDGQNPKPEFAGATEQERVATFDAWFNESVDVAIFGSDMDRRDFERTPADDHEDVIDFVRGTRAKSSGTQEQLDRALEEAMGQVRSVTGVRGLGANTDTLSNRFWGSAFVVAAYGRGFLEAVSQVRSSGGIVSPEYIKRAVRGGQHYTAIKQLRVRQFNDLRKIKDKTAAEVKRAISQAVREGAGAEATANLINDRIEKITQTRCRLLARTELISAYNESSLNLYEDAGVKGVLLEPELLTAEDDRVCDVCEEAARQSYTIETARGVIPLHPNCRCAWAPILKGAEKVRL